MSKTIELIYSQQSTDYIPGRAYSNPRFFTSPRSGVSKVFLVGDWPDIRAAYENLGIPVERLDASEAERQASNIPLAPAPARDAAEDPGSVVIPEGWEALPWSRPGEDGLTLRGLASLVSPAPVLNKAEAAAAIEAELIRRGAAGAGPVVDPLDVAQPEACGLTLRELHADLTALGVQWAPDATPAQLLAERDEARMLAEAG
jgi:hypothetical protein